METPVVFVISSDWTLRAMVRAELREAGIEALGMENIRDMVEALHRGTTPSLIVIDGVELEKPVTRETIEEMSRNIPILVVDSRVTPAPILPSAEILPRPIRVQDIVSRVLTRLSRKTA
jgi:DNA-binding response OmpR family regulator